MALLIVLNTGPDQHPVIRDHVIPWMREAVNELTKKGFSSQRVLEAAQDVERNVKIAGAVGSIQAHFVANLGDALAAHDAEIEANNNAS